MFKKVVSAIMVAAMVGTMVAPVSVSAKDGGETIELWTCWTEGADTEKASQEMIQKWEEETGNTVNQTNFTYDMLHEKILTAAAGGNVPDLIWGLPEYVGEFYTSTCSTSSVTSVPAPNPWWPWWLATPSVAATCCT